MLVIYKDITGYKVSHKNSYNKQYNNASAVIDCKAFTSADDIIEYFTKYYGKNKNDFIIIDK